MPRTQLRWNGILEEANSDDERKWRLAILEADIMLNELLESGMNVLDTAAMYPGAEAFIGVS